MVGEKVQMNSSDGWPLPTCPRRLCARGACVPAEPVCPRSPCARGARVPSETVCPRSPCARGDRVPAETVCPRSPCARGDPRVPAETVCPRSPCARGARVPVEPVALAHVNLNLGWGSGCCTGWKDALGTHWTLRTPTRKPNWETKAGRRGQTLTDVVGGSGQAARRGPQRGRGRGREWAWAAHATVARATALSRRGLLGHCPGHTGRVIHQMAVCCVSQLSGAE
ncbi:hypothetical protein EI555_000379 [Monodon monoceros]|uniref:Uncharacterized protein n=1 Tax=Monodon monoceros TaxID=40151 RepID=A0A4V6WPC5_MONMO|nr:hypothetical protein EI555_000379 [Monodon monoceros]